MSRQFVQLPLSVAAFGMQSQFTFHFRLLHLNSTTVIREQDSWIKIPCNHNEPLTAMICCRCLESWDSLGEP